MSQIVMLLSNPFRPDSRVLKEAHSLVEVGHTVTILCWDRAAELVPDEQFASNVRVLRIQNVRSSYGIGARQLLRLPLFWKSILPCLNQIKPDLIHCHDFDTLPAGLYWGKVHRIPVVYDAHEYYADLCKPRLYGFTGKLLYRLIRISELWGARLASAVITVDESLGAIYRRQNRHVLIVGHYPSRSFAVQAAPVFTHAELNLLYVGRLSSDRGLLLYVEILRFLLQRGIPARLHLAGVFTPESEKLSFEENCKDLQKQIVHHGWIPYDRLSSLLMQADLGLSILLPEPRYVAALPVKLFEYMSAGLPVVASNFPLISQVISSTKCGLLIDPQQHPDSIANLLLEWWQQPEIPKELGTNGRNAILEQYNWERLSSQLASLYSSLLNQSTPTD